MSATLSKLGVWVVLGTSVTHVVCHPQMRIFNSSFAYLFWLANNNKTNIQSSMWASVIQSHKLGELPWRMLENLSHQIFITCFIAIYIIIRSNFFLLCILGLHIHYDLKTTDQCLPKMPTWRALTHLTSSILGIRWTRGDEKRARESHPGEIEKGKEEDEYGVWWLESKKWGSWIV